MPFSVVGFRKHRGRHEAKLNGPSSLTAMCQKFEQLHIPLFSANSCSHETHSFSWVSAQKTAMENLEQVHTLTIQAVSQGLGDHSCFLWPALWIPDLPSPCNHFLYEIPVFRNSSTQDTILQGSLQKKSCINPFGGWLVKTEFIQLQKASLPFPQKALIPL